MGRALRLELGGPQRPDDLPPSGTPTPAVTATCRSHLASAAAVALVLATFGLATVIRAEPALAVASRPVSFGSIAMHKAGWRATDRGPLDRQSQEMLRPDAYLDRLYVRLDGFPVDVTIVYGHAKETFHSPGTCLLGAGWSITRKARYSLDTGATGGWVDANCFSLQRGDERRVALYWYASTGETTPSWIAFQYRLLRNRLTGRPATGALVRFIAPRAGVRRGCHSCDWRADQGDLPRPAGSDVALTAHDRQDTVEERMGMAEVAVEQATVRTMGADRTEARARAAIFHLIWLLPCLVVQIWFFSTQFQGLVMPDAMDAAQVGRHISNGQGFVTSILRPLSIAVVPKTVTHPDLYNAPLFPLTLGVAFNIAGASDRTVGLVCLIFAILTALMTYRLGSALAGRGAGALAAVLVTLTTGLLKSEVAGMNISLLMLLLTGLGYAVLRHRGTARWSLICGGLASLAYLTDYSALLFAAPACALVAASQPQSRLRHPFLFLVGFALVLLPWAVRNVAVTGSPFGGLQSYSVAMWGESHPGATLYRSQEPGSAKPIQFAVSNPREVVKKALLNLGGLEAQVPVIYGMVLLALLGLAFFTRLGAEMGDRLKWGVLAGILLMGLSGAIGQPRYDFLYGLLGVVAALGAAACILVLSRLPSSRRASTWAVAALIALSAYPVALYVLPGSQPSRPDHRNLEYLGRALPAETVILTDRPSEVAWYADRIAVWLPAAGIPRPKAGEKMTLVEAADATKSKGYQTLERAGVKPAAIYLSSGMGSYPAAEGIGGWQWLYGLLSAQLQAAQRGQPNSQQWTPYGWQIAATLPPGDFLLTRSVAATARQSTAN